MRIDKWLWAARFFKTRSLAASACEFGRIEVGGQQVKPARDIHAGDKLKIRNDGGDFQVEVLGLSEMRGPAPAAQLLYRESDESKAQRAKAAQDRRAMPHIDTDGKPSKRDRREINRLRGR